jgi:hypothetical protein
MLIAGQFSQLNSTQCLSSSALQSNVQTSTFLTWHIVRNCDFVNPRCIARIDEVLFRNRSVQISFARANVCGLLCDNRFQSIEVVPIREHHVL